MHINMLAYLLQMRRSFKSGHIVCPKINLFHIFINDLGDVLACRSRQDEKISIWNEFEQLEE